MKRYLWLGIPLAIALLWFGAGWRPAAVFYDAVRDWLGGTTITVRAAQVTKRAIDVELHGSGVLEPLEWADVVAPLAGTVGPLHVKIGEAVKVGQVVATIRAGEIIERLEKSEQALRLAETALKKSAGALAGALERLEKTRELRARDLIAGIDLNAAEADAAAASAARDLARAQIAQQEAEVAQLRQLLALSNLLAPVAGVVTKRWVEPGAQVQSAAPVLTIAALGSFKIIIEIPAQYFLSIHQGLAAQIEPVGSPSPARQGQVAMAHPDTKSGQEAAVVEIHLASTELRWLPGLQASVTLRLKDKRNALLVPKQALVERDGRTFVYVIVDGRARRKQVTTGASQNGMIEISSRVAEGEWIIVADPQTIEPERRVRVLKDGH